MVSGRVWFFCFNAVALAPRSYPPRFQADAAAARAVGSGRDVHQGTGCRSREPGVDGKFF